MLYGPSGIGKTSLAANAPSPIFIGVDDGGRKITGADGKPVNAVAGIETFQDIRDALHQLDLFPKGTTLILDTVTRAEAMGENHVFETVKLGQNQVATSIEDYGYGKGYRFLTEAMRCLLTDLDPLILRGVSVVLLAQQGQATVANLEGVDYLQDGPKLYRNKNGTGVGGEYVEWCDHVFRIGFQAPNVALADPKAKKGKASGSMDRVIYTSPELHYVAKSRPVKGQTLPPVISFENSTDASLWTFLFQ